MEQKEKTDVNYEAVNAAPQGGPHNPYDDALAFKSLLGAVHGEFNRMVNDNMVSESNTLKKVNGKAILEKGVMEIMGKQQVQPNVPPVLNPNEQIPAPVTVAQPTPQQIPLHQPVIENTQPVEDPNQLTLNFDNTATAQDIFNKLDDLEVKINNLTKIVQSLLPTKKKTVVKK